LKGQVLAVRHSTTELGKGAGVEGGRRKEGTNSLTHHDSDTNDITKAQQAQHFLFFILYFISLTTFSQNDGSVFFLFCFLFHTLSPSFSL
jgi:hypothetical protein